MGDLPASASAYKTVPLQELAASPMYALTGAPIAELEPAVLQAAFALEPRVSSASALVANASVPRADCAKQATIAPR